MALTFLTWVQRCLLLLLSRISPRVSFGQDLSTRQPPSRVRETVRDQKETTETALFTTAYWLVFVLFHGKTRLAPIASSIGSPRTHQSDK